MKMNIFVTVQTLAETSSYSTWDEIQKVAGIFGFLEGKMISGDKEAQVFPHIERIGAAIRNHHAPMSVNVRGDGRQPQD